ncbi:MAG: TaqI-like C-terminal specificity domain-containing protein [Planctomycetota bacterium]
MQVQSPRILGRVFTPAKVASALATVTLRGLDGERVCVLDPACGGGALLAAAAQVLGARAELEGWDKDRASLEEARATLHGARSRPTLRRRDALFEGRGTFDAVIANPPWVSFSGRESVAIAPALRKRLRARFASFRGWPSLQGPFLERAFELVRPGGRIGFVLPRQVLELDRYAPLRALVSERGRLVAVNDLGEDVFPGVCEPAATVVWERPLSTVPAAGPGDDARIECRPELPRWALRALDRLARWPRFPRELVSDPGVHTGNAAEHVLSGRARRGFVPCREGKDVNAFALSAPRIFVAREPDLAEPLYARVRAEERYRETTILVRQTANRPIAARHEPWAYFRNSALAVRSGPFAPELLLALLNSRLFALAHRAGFADARQRAFPQVKVGALATLPFTPQAPPALFRLVRRREEGAPEDAELERAVCALFGLDDETVRPLLDWLPAERTP